MMSRIDSWHRKISTGRHFQNGHHNTAQIHHGSISMFWIDFRHRKMSTGLHFQNGRHNTAKIQHCPISSKFDMWVDNDVPNWFPTLKNFYRSPFSKWPPQYCTNSTLNNFQCWESIRDIIIYPHIKFWWHWTMLNFCGIVAAILKMTTGRNCSMLGINSGHHYLPTYQISRIDSQHWKFFSGRHFQNGRHNTAKIQHCPISSKFDMWVNNDIPNWLPTLKNFYRSTFSKWPRQYRKYSTLSDIIKIWYVGR
jgi:hypothetical protein